MLKRRLNQPGANAAPLACFVILDPPSSILDPPSTRGNPPCIPHPPPAVARLLPSCLPTWGPELAPFLTRPPPRRRAGTGRPSSRNADRPRSLSLLLDVAKTTSEECEAPGPVAAVANVLIRPAAMLGSAISPSPSYPVDGLNRAAAEIADLQARLALQKFPAVRHRSRHGSTPQRATSRWASPSPVPAPSILNPSSRTTPMPPVRPSSSATASVTRSTLPFPIRSITLSVKGSAATLSFWSTAAGPFCTTRLKTQATATWPYPPAPSNALVQNGDGTWTLTQPNGFASQYGTNGLLSRLVSPSGRPSGPSWRGNDPVDSDYLLTAIVNPRMEQ